MVFILFIVKFGVNRNLATLVVRGCQSQDYMYMDFNAFDLLINTENCTLSDEVALVHKLFE